MTTADRSSRFVASGKLGRIHHYRGTYLQDWPVEPSMPLYWRFRKEKSGSGSLGTPRERAG